MSHQDDYDYVFKILIVGPSGVGKTSLLNRYVDQVFTEQFVSTIGVDFKTVTLDSKTSQGIIKRVKLHLWDTAGQERFNSISHSYYRGAQGVIFVFDLNDIKSLEDLKKWINVADDYNINKRIVVGNKNDLPKTVSDAQVAAFCAESPGMTYLVTSAKTGENIAECIETLANDLTELRSRNQLQAGELKTVLNLEQSPRERDEIVARRGCCGGTG